MDKLTQQQIRNIYIIHDTEEKIFTLYKDSNIEINIVCSALGQNVSENYAKSLTRS